jgi:hypothetical protein
MPKDVIDYLNGVMKRYSKNSSEFQYIKKGKRKVFKIGLIINNFLMEFSFAGLKCRERCNLLELAKRDSCL